MNNLLYLIAKSPLSDLLENKLYSSRFESEMKMLESLNQIENISIATKIKDSVKDMELPFFIRGSAGGSLVLYLLGFTPIDPVKNNITFERFINQYRTSLGDIDFDLPRTLRNNIMNNVNSKLNNNIGILCTKVYYKEKSSIREAIRQVCNYRKFIPKEIFYDKEILSNFIKEKCNGNPDNVLNKANELKGKLNFYSTHVGGITILNQNDKYIEKKTKPSKQKLPLVALDKNDIDKQKRFKIDLLSNTGLDIINMVYGNIELTHLNFPLDDKVLNLIGEGNTIGIVYGESPLIRTTFTDYHKKYKIKNIEDIAKCLSIIRPMCRGENNNAIVSNLIFDDDWITTLSETLNIDYAEADKVRRRLAKNDGTDSDIKKQLLTKVSSSRLKQLMQIKNYGFCKAHAMNYAMLIYCQSYAKVYKTCEFFCAVLNTINGRIYDDWVYFFDALKNGMKIKANKKSDTYIVKNGSCKIIQPKNGIQLLLKSMSPLEEIQKFNGLTSLIGIEQLHLIACSRSYKDLVFSTELIDGNLVNVITYL
jgi:DNA polymerase-3 subunit alpha